MKAGPSVSIFLSLYALFFICVAVIIVVNYSGQQEQMMKHIQSSTTAQTATIKEALVNMSVRQC